MKEILAPVERKLLLSELNDDTFVRRTNNGNKELFIIDNSNSPNTMLEIGRLREISFREGGGGTGKEVDIDEYDTFENPFKQLLVWDPKGKEIVGGYRFLEGEQILKNGGNKPDTPTSHLFNMSDDFINNYLPKTIELGRSFVQPLYQPNYNLRQGLYSLDNLWDGLGYLMINKPNLKYFFGKITMYPNFNAQARDMIHYFLNNNFGDKDKLITPIKALNYKTDINTFKSMFSGTDYIADFKTLNTEVRKLGENIPPLVNAYMNLSSTMKYFGTAINERFGNVEESGIFITVDDIYEKKKARHISNIIFERI
ncbi:MAG: GNAT family N-acetyltransferase [Bacteroidales bacterium]|nr:GNAT family N-acetyltransferase [Bacteroidales bacterium]